MTSGPDDDAALAARAGRGDQDALEILLRRHQPRLYALCRRMTGNDADALDACQEALIAVARGVGRFDGRSSFGTWAYRVATNACLDELRRRQRRPVPESDAERLDGARLALAPAADPGDAVAGRLDIDSALAGIRPEYRAAVVLRDLCDLSYAEIADSLGVPPGTVRSRIARGRSALAELLAGSQNPAAGNPEAGNPGAGNPGAGNPEAGNPEGGPRRPSPRPPMTSS